MALFKMLSMRAQDCEKFADLDAMIDSRKIAHLDKLAKIIYSKLKGQNVFLETSEKELARWSGKIQKILPSGLQVASIWMHALVFDDFRVIKKRLILVV